MKRPPPASASTVWACIAAHRRRAAGELHDAGAEPDAVGGAAMKASGVTASEPYASAVHTESKPSRSAVWISSIGSWSRAPEYPMPSPSFIAATTRRAARRCACRWRGALRRRRSSSGCRWRPARAAGRRRAGRRRPRAWPGRRVSGSKTLRSAAKPSRTSPRSAKPHAVAGAKVIIRTASSRVKTSRSRTQWASRWVWIEQSMIWLTWAPESEKVISRARVLHDRQQIAPGRGWRELLDEELLEVRSRARGRS